jgi:glycosyltransferase involved in cell wall biosynthesis
VKAFTFADGSGFRSELELTPDNVLVGMIGRISPEKGQALFVEAMLPLLREFEFLHAVIIGEASDRDHQYEERIQETISRSGVAPRFALVGWRHDVRDILPAMDIVSHTSGREGFSMTVLEAMASARPIAAFAAGGVVEAVLDGVTGLLIAPGDVSAMTHAIRRLLLNPEERTTMGIAAQQRARQLFDDSDLLPQFSAIIDENLIHERTSKKKKGQLTSQSVAR